MALNRPPVSPQMTGGSGHKALLRKRDRRAVADALKHLYTLYERNEADEYQDVITFLQSKVSWPIDWENSSWDPDESSMTVVFTDGADPVRYQNFAGRWVPVLGSMGQDDPYDERDLPVVVPDDDEDATENDPPNRSTVAMPAPAPTMEGMGKPRIGGGKWLRHPTGGSHVPEESAYHAAATQAYEAQPQKELPGGYEHVYSSPEGTLHAWKHESSPDMLVGVRGTYGIGDFPANASLPFNQLHTTDRYKADEKSLKELLARHPGSQVHFASHSLGSAVARRLEDVVPTVSSRAYNPAFEASAFLKPGKQTRVYTGDDFLSKVGRYLPNAQHINSSINVPDKQIKWYDPRTWRTVKHHSLESFKTPTPKQRSKVPLGMPSAYRKRGRGLPEKLAALLPRSRPAQIGGPGGPVRDMRYRGPDEYREQRRREAPRLPGPPLQGRYPEKFFALRPKSDQPPQGRFPVKSRPFMKPSLEKAKYVGGSKGSKRLHSLLKHLQKKRFGGSAPSATNPTALNPEQMRKAQSHYAAEDASVKISKTLIAPSVVPAKMPTVRSQLNPAFMM